MIIYPSSGTGAWEAAIVNTLAPGDRVLMCETGQFAVLWRSMAEKFGSVDFVPGDWRRGADLAADRGAAPGGPGAHDQSRDGRSQRDLDRRHHRIAELRKTIDRVNHPALLMVDTIFAGLHRLSSR